MEKKANTSKWIKITLSLTVFTTSAAYADGFDKFKNTVANEFSSLQGLYIAGGLVVASLLVYVVYNHLIKEKEDPELSKHAAKPGQNYRRHRQHHQAAKSNTKK